MPADLGDGGGADLQGGRQRIAGIHRHRCDGDIEGGGLSWRRVHVLFLHVDGLSTERLVAGDGWRAAPCCSSADWCKGCAMTAIGILGSEGRMGRAIASIASDLGASVAGGIDAGGDPLALARGCDVLVDFTAPSALEANLAAAVEAGTPIVISSASRRTTATRSMPCRAPRCCLATPRRADATRRSTT